MRLVVLQSQQMQALRSRRYQSSHRSQRVRYVIEHCGSERIAIYPESSEAEPWDRSSVGLSRFAAALCELYRAHSPRRGLSLADRLPFWQLPLVCSFNSPLRSFAWQRLCRPIFSLGPRNDRTNLEWLAGLGVLIGDSHSLAIISQTPSMRTTQDALVR